MTLRTRLAFWFAGLLALTITLFSIAIFALVWWSMVRDVDATLGDSANLINQGTTLITLHEPQGTSYVVNLPELAFMSASGTEAQVWVESDGAYKLIDATGDIQQWPNALDPNVLDLQAERAFSTVNIEGNWWRVHTNPIWAGGQIIGSIQVARSMETIYVATRSLLAVVVGCSMIAIGSAVILSRWLAKRLLEPIEDLTSAASRIAGASDLSTRLTWNGPNDELGRLIAVFNRMMERLQNVFAVQQRFIADISHELRTPLTGIIGNVDIMRRYGADAESLNAIHSDTARMSRLVHDLLMLARADYGGSPIHPMPLDADSVVTGAARAARLAADQKGVQLTLGHLEPLRIMGDPQQLQQLFDNLIDNAIKFTPAGGQITISMQRVDQSARIEITDTGPGIAAEHQAHIFDRFYQVDSARTQDGTAGFGLGLSVARWIAEAHHGSIEVRSQQGAGATFTVHLPLVNAFHDDTNPSPRRMLPQRPPRIDYTTDRPATHSRRPVGE